jgi:hypothetical protein
MQKCVATSPVARGAILAHLPIESSEMTMTGAVSTLPRPFTLNDISVGTKVFAALVQHARAHPGQTVFYGDLLEQARALFPGDEEMQRAVPIGIGMKLLFVQAFCESNGYPNLACLAVNKGRNIPGISYPGDWEREMREVAGFDWSAVKPVLDAYVARAVTVATPLRRRPEAEARDQLFVHFRANRAVYERFSYSDREEMVGLLMEGLAIDTALDTVLQAKAALD